MRRNESGASAVEYALLISAIAAVIMAIVFAMGLVVRTQYTATCDELSTRIAGTAC